MTAEFVDKEHQITGSAVSQISNDVVDFSFVDMGVEQKSPIDNDGFNLDDIRVQNTEIQVKTDVLPKIGIGRPKDPKFMMVHSDYSIDTYVLDGGYKVGFYLLARPLWDELAGESAFKIQRLVMTITPQGELSVWPLRLHNANGRMDSWAETALELAEHAKHHWIRVASNMETSRYVGVEAQGTLPEPQWPDMSFEEMLKLAFRDRWITSLDHPMLRRLRGEIV